MKTRHKPAELGRPRKRAPKFGMLRVSVRCLAAGASLSALAATSGHADVGVTPPPIYNLFGQIGLLDMPSARFADDGTMSATFGADRTGERYNLGMEVLPWAEVTFRYSRLDKYESDGSDLYDRSLSVKIRLLQESEYLPSIAIGAQDVLGTGVYAGEYIDAAKQFGDFDFSLGVGWRGLAGFAPFTNPFTLIFPGFKNSHVDVSTGQPLIGGLFHGKNVGLFGGVTWQTPINGLAMILELTGATYTREQQVGSIKLNSRLDYGLSYQPMPGVEVGAAWMYGSEFALRVTLHMNAFDDPFESRLGTPPLSANIRTPDQRKDAVLDMLQSSTHYYDNWGAAPPKLSGDVSTVADSIFDAAASKNFTVKDVEVFNDSLMLSVSGAGSDLPCSKFAAAASADGHGIHQIAISFAGTSEVKLCDVKSAQANGNLPARLFETVDQHDANDNGMPDGQGTGTQPEPVHAPGPASAKQGIRRAAKLQHLVITAIEISSTRIEISFRNDTYRSNAEALGRLLRILMAEAPNSVEVFRVVQMAGDTPTISTTFSRSDVERILQMSGSAQELLPLTVFAPVGDDDPLLADHLIEKFPKFGYSVAPGLHKSFFDPNNPFRVGLYAALNGDVALDRHFDISGSVEINIYNTFNTSIPSDSVLPHVRTDWAEYYQHGANGISYLQASYTTKLAPDVYALAKVGYFEDMFAGVGGEVLWEPFGERWAAGADLFEVQQRQFNRLFGLRGYHVLTGHASLYYQSPYYGLDFELHVGRYLAGDYGATFQVTRRFDNGIEIGAYATLTNVPFSEFGEGSFDKGFIIRIPVENLAPVNTQDEMSLDFTPITRDGGQRLVGEQTLYRYLQPATEGDSLANWNQVLEP